MNERHGEVFGGMAPVFRFIPVYDNELGAIGQWIHFIPTRHLPNDKADSCHR